MQNVPLDPFQPNPDPTRLITFRLGEALYALPLRYVREVVSYEAPALAFLNSNPSEEVILLRGALLPVLHVRQRLAANGPSPAARGFIIILRFEARHVGLVVDSVEQVLKPDSSELGSSDDLYVKGLVEADGVLLRLLNLEQVIPAVYLHGPRCVLAADGTPLKLT